MGWQRGMGPPRQHKDWYIIKARAQRPPAIIAFSARRGRCGYNVVVTNEVQQLHPPSGEFL